MSIPGYAGKDGNEWADKAVKDKDIKIVHADHQQTLSKFFWISPVAYPRHIEKTQSWFDFTLDIQTFCMAFLRKKSDSQALFWLFNLFF